MTQLSPIRILARQLWRWQSTRRLRRSRPRISLVLAVKNGLPHLRKTIEALRRQTYKNFELLVQDGGSTDGSLAFLESIRDLPALDVASAPDGGLGQAYNRGIARCRGDIVCLISCDEWLEDDALQKAVAWYARYPEAAVICGAVRLTDADDRPAQLFSPAPFELQGVLHCEIVPPMGAAFLNRSQIAEDLYYDELLKTCPDFDFWLRVGNRFDPGAFIMMPDPVVVARSDLSSMSYRAESFEQFCKDKVFILNRYLKRSGSRPDHAGLAKTAAAGIFTWAAESVFALEGASPGFLGWCAKAAELNPRSVRLRKLARDTLAFEIDPAGGFAPKTKVQPDTPSGRTQAAKGLLCLDEIESLAHWDADIDRRDMLRVVTGKAPWAYASRIPLHLGDGLDKDHWYWARLNVQVLAGQVGIGLLADHDLCQERLIGPAEGRLDVFVRISDSSAEALLIRNGALPGQSVLMVFDATGERCQIM